MKILSFSAKDLHSYLNFNLNFHTDVSFLYGINGSGKTTILRAITSILTPDFVWLSEIKFSEIAIKLNIENKNYLISLKKNPEHLIVKIDGDNSIINKIETEEIKSILEPSDDEYGYGRIDSPQDIIIKKLSEKYESVEFISRCQTPIFLGLDRTTLTHQMLRRRAERRSVQRYFRTQLDDALLEAEKVLYNEIIRVDREKNEILQELREKFILSLFLEKESRESTLYSDNINLREFDKMKSSVLTALKKMKIAESGYRTPVEDFFDDVKNAAREKNEAEKKFNRRKEKHDVDELLEYANKTSRYAKYQPLIETIKITVERIKDADNKEALVTRKLNEYKNIMDNFFNDSGKSLVLDYSIISISERNKMQILLPSGKREGISLLSSGERQIFVLITHLFFNSAMRGENILIIDEPELSLHLKWQRQFVDAVRKASPETQMILATHSPEIIHKNHDKTIDVVGK